MITKRSISKPNSIEEFGEIAISKKKRSFSFSCSRPLSSSQTTTRHTIRPATQDRPPRMGIEPRHRNKPVGWRSGSPKAYPYHSRTSRRDIQSELLVKAASASVPSEGATSNQSLTQDDRLAAKIAQPITLYIDFNTFIVFRSFIN